MAKKNNLVDPPKPKRTPVRSKAQQAAQKAPKEIFADQRTPLYIRLIASFALVFLTLFLFLSMFGVHALLLDLFMKFIKGMFGYAYWVAPAVFLFMAWMLFFLHDESITLRMIASGLFALLLSALIHTVVCNITFEGGLSILKSLYQTGVENHSGGVIPGLMSLGLQSLISKGGTIPVLLVLLLAVVFVIFRISAAKLIHDRAEKRRQLLEELAQEQQEQEPVVYDTKADLRVLATPAIRPRTQEGEGFLRRKQTDFDLPLGGSAAPTPRKRTKPAEESAALPAEAHEEELDEDLIFLNPKKTRKAAVPAPAPEKEPSPFDIPIGGSYAQQVQELAQEEIPFDEPYDEDEPELLTDTVTPVQKPADTISQTELLEAAEDAKKDQTVTHDQAAQAAVEVAKAIEKNEDAAAQEQPVYKYPPMSMLAEAMETRKDNTEEMQGNVRRLENALESFGVKVQINNVIRGPAVTRYETELQPGIKMSKITSLNDDIALSLGVSGVHVAAVPGKISTIGFEVPNTIVTSVPIREVLTSREFKNHKSALAFAAGKDISGNYIIGDIAKMPHLLIAGTTGSGKSVCMNSIIVSLLYRSSPEDCRLIMIDPKEVELNIYNGIPHLLIPVVTDPKKAAGALQWAVTEMERRYSVLKDANARDLAGFNKKAALDPELQPMPRIVVIIDELADLMMTAAKEVETSIARLTAKARAAGIHLVIATQRPSADIITGVIKANIPTRIAFAVSSAMESNIIMGVRGAEKLVGKGDMFYKPQGQDKPTRVQGCFISDDEVEQVVEYVKSSSTADYSQDIINEIENTVTAAKDDEDDAQTGMDGYSGDVRLPEAVEVILETKQASTSMLQRRLRLGYSHAARIMDELSELGIVGPYEGSKPRQLLITQEQWDTMVSINPNAVAAPEEDLDGDDVPFEEDEEA